MKKLFAFTVCFITLFVCVFASSCSDSSKKEYSFEATVISNDALSFAFKAADGADGSKSVYDYLDYFSSCGTITLESKKESYGVIITSINGSAQTEDYSKYWSFYLSFTDRNGVTYASAEYGVCEIGGMTLYSASYTADSVPVFGGETYAFTYTSFES